MNIMNSKWSVERLLKKFFVLNDEILGNADGVIVDTMHVLMVCEGLEVVDGKVFGFDVDISNGLKIPDIGDLHEVVVTGVREKFVRIGNTLYSIEYFVPVVKAFGTVKKFLNADDYPLRIEFVNGVVVLLAPAILTREVDDLVEIDDKGIDWFPGMYGVRKYTAAEKLKYLMSMDPGLKIGEALEKLETLTKHAEKQTRLNG